MTRTIVLVVACLLTLAASAARGQQSPARADHDDGGAGEVVAAEVVALAPSASDPAGCWDDYVTRAIEVYLNYLDCALKNEWYDFIGYFICELSYEFGALMALVKFLSCLA